MSLGLFSFILIYGAINVFGGLFLHIILTLKYDDYNVATKGYWGIIWKLDLLKNINNCGKIIIEILYTIMFLPIIIISYLFLLIILIAYFSIIKPFVFIFKKGDKKSGKNE